MTTHTAESVDMTIVQGAEVRARRLRLGMTIEQLADEADVSADTLGDFEAGKRQPRELTLSKVAAALDRIEEEVGIDAPTPGAGVVSFDVSAEGGFHVVVKGPIADADKLREQVTAIIREMRNRDDTQG